MLSARVCQFQLSPYHLHDPPMRLVGSSASIHDDHPLRFAGGDGQIRISHPSKERAAFLLEPVLVTFRTVTLASLSLVATAGAVHALGHVRIHQNRKFRPQTTA